MTIWHITGPPGTGKTTYCAAQATLAAEAHGSDAVTIASLTRAAAAEIAGRRVPIVPEQVGTLHALCYRALGNPDLVEKDLDDWNQRHPSWSLSPASGALESADERTSGQPGDEVRERLELLRARCTPRHLWPQSVVAFEAEWTAWKGEVDLLDFTDLLERAIGEVPCAPGDPAVLIGDEVQDWSRLETQLFRDVWGKQAETVLLCGDPDQAIFEWRGADARIFEDHPVPPENDRVLETSYRVPRAVHALAQRIIRQIKNRRDVVYHPRDAEGAVRRSPTSWKNPHGLIPLCEEAAAGGPTIMILASCGFMLNPLIAKLRQAGIPFHNPYRRREGRWNPLAWGAKRRTTAVDRLLAFLRPEVEVWGPDVREWTAEDVRRFLEPLRAAGVLSYGGKTKLKSKRFDPETELEDVLEGGLKGEVATRLIAGDLAWYEAHLLESRRRPFVFPLEILRQRGPQALRENPRVMVGTIHSVKGGQADRVVVFPDLSNEGAQGFESGARDPIWRLFYVAVTRAREALYLGTASSPLHVRIPL